MKPSWAGTTLSSRCAFTGWDNIMRWILVSLGLLLSAPALGATTVISEAASSEAILRWINGYRAHPDIAKVPLAMRALSRIGALDQPEKAAVFVGFFAGVLAA